MQKAEKNNVYKVYDKIASWFAQNRHTGLMEKKYLDDLIGRIPVNGTVLDLGCGTGKPILEYLVNQNLHVTGVEASSAMLAIAKTDLPTTEFILQDMRSVDLDRKFDAIIAWHSLFHLPTADQSAMFALFERHLNVNGILLFTSGTDHGETWTVNGGEDLFLASLNTEEYAHLLIKHHFQVLQHVISDPDCGSATVWMAQYTVSAV